LQAFPGLSPTVRINRPQRSFLQKADDSPKENLSLKVQPPFLQPDIIYMRKHFYVSSLDLL
jgi:hypothetical protein